MSHFPASTPIERRLLVVSVVMVVCAILWNLQIRERRPVRKGERDQHAQRAP